MARLETRHLNAVHRAVRNKPLAVTLGTIWEDIRRHVEIGTPRSGKLKLNDADYRALRTFFLRVEGWDPITPPPAGNRTEIARQSRDDKRGAERPGDNFVLVKGNLPAPLPQLPAELSLRVPLDRLALAQVRNLVLVENLDSFDQWQEYRIPETLNDALVLYRGHGGLARGARKLIAQLPESVCLHVFPDFDPAGLVIAVSMSARGLLIPALGDKLMEKSHRDHFERQYRQSKHLDELELGCWRPVWQAMREQRLSIKQQHMLAFDAALQLVMR
ncbi:DUF7281 domain-containing protein [Stutzerimonas stutzeri]|uniref:DUF7281 domain-containing protein n=1 Tax=Stutzerimonas stutzeri TaxID=316 RepID=UPI0015E454AE|nr:hypothetical protein [Stutzerimonas stutzeri]MBA1279486.1 hypothetical protein [Stutzerimonas stutzeri]